MKQSRIVRKTKKRCIDGNGWHTKISGGNCKYRYIIRNVLVVIPVVPH
ncbi:hypothetical protein UAY_01561 [Enterococcus moraviensis ATCC BAA-383]|uniref:Uncharacterized protein n=1 Tax=Enterococcus moraviensis ATCC BAA-383 TaxID=1158609 RepID=R2SZ32_9ENTE|nr:hypothetical protein [Enterococcus moraviensis]EOI00458.1 hypothetical protein UAY_01561 [Enterococcus moraviensis ATCC BAA-383]EOT73313.1 hypothetical protein I586_00306 [Enterococcus moraviensis ATCC BAA-383]